jgi:Fungal N-terminal domain of STAND proteins
MDPFSIAVGCASLIGTITKLSTSISSFVKSARAARGDLDALSRELTSLKTLVELLEEDAKDESAFPDTLRQQISGIVTNCAVVLDEIERLLDKFDGPGATRSAKWASGGKDDTQKLRISLEAHKSALEIALEMVSL